MPSSSPACESDSGSGAPRGRWAQAGGIAAGVLLGAVGAFFSGAYAWSLVEVLDEADRSVVFWYLIFLFTGVGLSVTGTVLLAWLAREGGPGEALVPRRVVRGLAWAVGVAGALTAGAGVALALWHAVAP